MCCTFVARDDKTYDKYLIVNKIYRRICVCISKISILMNVEDAGAISRLFYNPRSG